jgi:hypothetical protein
MLQNVSMRERERERERERGEGKRGREEERRRVKGEEGDIDGEKRTARDSNANPTGGVRTYIKGNPCTTIREVEGGVEDEGKEGKGEGEKGVRNRVKKRKSDHGS